MSTPRRAAPPSNDPPPWLASGAAHVWRPYCQHKGAPPPLAVVGCHGSRLVLAGGGELVDGTASWWTAAHGYRHPRLVAAIEAQLARLPHVAFGGLAHEAGYALAARIASLLPAPLARVFLVESGSVAVEVAIKMAIQSLHNRGIAKRRVVAFEGAYHGDTFATMALCDPITGMHAAFAGAGVDAVHLAIPVAGDDRFEAELDRIAGDVACVVVEPLVQCAGGFRFHDAEALWRIRRACDRHGALLVLDEIATGFFRTGERFALDEARVVPDIVVLGKALSGGMLPLAATVATDAVFDAFLADDPSKALQHGPTYMANALACAAAQASLDLFAEGDTAARVRRLEASLRAELAPLRSARGVRDVRVKGAIGVIEMDAGAAPPSSAFAARGAFIRPIRSAAADFVYVMPPLVLDDVDRAILVGAIAGCLGA